MSVVGLEQLLKKFRSLDNIKSLSDFLTTLEGIPSAFSREKANQVQWHLNEFAPDLVKLQDCKTGTAFVQDRKSAQA